jgi:hypothetical protein
VSHSGSHASGLRRAFTGSQTRGTGTRRWADDRRAERAVPSPSSSPSLTVIHSFLIARPNGIANSGHKMESGTAAGHYSADSEAVHPPLDNEKPQFEQGAPP